MGTISCTQDRSVGSHTHFLLCVNQCTIVEQGDRTPAEIAHTAIMQGGAILSIGVVGIFSSVKKKIHKLLSFIHAGKLIVH